MHYYLKGHIQGYGKYNELTSKGVDPRELFDDVEDTRESPDCINTDIVIERCNDVAEEADQQAIESSNDLYLIPTRRHVRHSENDPHPTCNQALDRESMRTRSSMLSLISLPTEFEDNTRNNVVIIVCIYSMNHLTPII